MRTQTSRTDEVDAGVRSAGFSDEPGSQQFPGLPPNPLWAGEQGWVVATERSQTRLQKSPIGIDPKQFADYLAADLSPAEQGKISLLLKNFEGAKFAIGVDRLDYAKGIDKRAEAFNRLLAAEPGSISLLQIAPSSRADVEEYQKYKEDVEKDQPRQCRAWHRRVEPDPLHQ
ncbi:trehalose-6-phosphate synthase [Bradyrhizobium sp. CCBAU 65884]|uniref:trehalose-6-phosphate synthase n=1 Tax=Bradyrhizobium sp. CCBAU 65884 TaxID=722477 RepID=UPI0023068715|nr:trehalose-6-phosphate synthase [Bradyrhizobium sp. CCBAU 65884]